MNQITTSLKWLSLEMPCLVTTSKNRIFEQSGGFWILAYFEGNPEQRLYMR